MCYRLKKGNLSTACSLFKRNFQQYLETEKKLNCIKDPMLSNNVRINKSFNNLTSQESQPSLTSSCTETTNNITLYPTPIDLQFSDDINNINNDAANTPKTILNKNNVTLKDKLCKLISDYHISHNCVNELLQILKSEGLDLPKDVKTLLKTPKTHEIINVYPGSYIHIGVEYMVSPILVAYFDKLKCTNLIQLSINIDGLPITKNSKSTLWPILISFVNIVDLKHIVLPVGIYHGKFKKPDSIFDFLNNFMVEMKNILTHVLCVNNVTFKFEISQVVCDAPAKAFILNVKSHNAYNSCNSCIEEGEFINNRMSYLGISAALRTDESFRNKKDENYHKGESPLESFPINIIFTVVMDYMHNVCQGVMKRMLLFWVKGKKPVRFLNNNIELEISNQLIEFKPFFPSEFNRLPRSLEELEYWKATEFRSFLLYTGPIVLKGRLQKIFINILCCFTVEFGFY